ncbi:hypothetical protein M405DRAFT_846052 [Rhizopogon salebrosus TDB-379]|nr:hypothetical protein M405DRAFT_846052 [Rhizopogon salebrosus TDB-379]
MDGNFKAEHLHVSDPSDEVWLTEGLGFMVENGNNFFKVQTYHNHLQYQWFIQKDSLLVQPAIKSPKEKNVPAGNLILVESTHSSRHYGVMPEESSIDDHISMRADHSQAAKSFLNLPKKFGSDVLLTSPTPMEWQEYKSLDINQAPPASSLVTASQSLFKFGHNTFMDPDPDTPIVFETSKGILLFNLVKNKAHLGLDYERTMHLSIPL